MWYINGVFRKGDSIKSNSSNDERVHWKQWMRQPGPRETNGGAEMGCAKANKPLHLSFRPLDAQRQEAFLLSAKEGKKKEKKH